MSKQLPSLTIKISQSVFDSKMRQYILKSDYPKEPPTPILPKKKKIDFADNSSINFSWQVGNKYEIRTDNLIFFKFCD